MEKDFKKGLFVDKKSYKFKPFIEIDDEERVNIYEKYYEKQIPHFEAYLDYVNKIMCVLKHYRIVTGRTNFTARVKSIDSALENDASKALNDIYGMAINAGIAGESELLYLLLRSSLTQTRNIIKNKSNGYAAHHFSGFPRFSNLSERLKNILNTEFDAEKMYEQYIDSLPDYEKEKVKLDDQEIENNQEENQQEEKQDIKAYFIQYYNALNKYIEKKKLVIKGEKLEQLLKEIKQIEDEYYKKQELKEKDNIYQPIIEIQFKTIAVYEEATNGTAAHGDYKGIEIEEIQKEYDLKGRLPSSSLPAKMYESNFETNEYGEPVPVRRITGLTEKAEKTYPFLIVKRKQRENDEKSDTEQEL